MARKVEVVAHDPAWAQMFAEGAQQIAAVFGEEIVAVYHIGSTAIAGIKAKPILDFLVEVRDIEKVDQFNDKMVALGYQPRGEYGLPGRRYFVKQRGETHLHHIHTYQSDHPDLQRHLDFRDYMRAHPQEAQAYSRLKERLARQFPTDIDSYVAGKDAFIKEIDEKAARWRAERH